MDGIKSANHSAARRGGLSVAPTAKIPAAPSGAESGVVGDHAFGAEAPAVALQSTSPPTNFSHPAVGGRGGELRPSVFDLPESGTTPMPMTPQTPSEPAESMSAPSRYSDSLSSTGDTMPDVAASSRQRGPFVPLLLGGLALASWFSVQTWLLLGEKSALQATHASQQQTVESSGKLRQSLDAIAADTQRLSDSGNPNARLLVEELRKRGITINPNATAAPASK